MIQDRKEVESTRGSLNRLELSEMVTFTIYASMGNPQTSLWCPIDALESALVFSRDASVHQVLRIGRWAQIVFTIVQRVFVFVVHLYSFLSNYIEQQSVHVNFPVVDGRDRVETFSLGIPLRGPVPMQETFKVLCIYDGVLILRQWDKAVRCIRRLNDCVAFHASRLNPFWHRSSLQGLFQFNRILAEGSL